MSEEKIKRYEPRRSEVQHFPRQGWQTTGVEMAVAEDGGWVEYSEHVKIVQSLKRKIINDFIAKVEAIALVPMGFSYVAHYEAILKLQREMNNEA